MSKLIMMWILVFGAGATRIYPETTVVIPTLYSSKANCQAAVELMREYNYAEFSIDQFRCNPVFVETTQRGGE